MRKFGEIRVKIDRISVPHVVVAVNVVHALRAGLEA
jgi:hypothetical protein